MPGWVGLLFFVKLIRGCFGAPNNCVSLHFLQKEMPEIAAALKKDVIFYELDYIDYCRAV